MSGTIVWSIDPPTVTAGQTAKACARSIGDPAIKQALRDALPHLIEHSTAFQASAAADRLHELTSEAYRVPGVTDAEMRGIYTRNLVRVSSPGRKIYEKLVRGLCAYCQHAPATTLDHFIPKAEIGGLSIEPWNLVPCCPACNHILRDEWSCEASEQMLHPYFIGDVGRWLYAKVLHEEPPAVTFTADPGPSVDPELASRIRRQFTHLKLSKMFSEICAPDLSMLEVQLTARRFQNRADIAGYLNEVAEAAFAVNGNARRGVLHDALASDDWYVGRFVA
jgi:hypothetical protein